MDAALTGPDLMTLAEFLAWDPPTEARWQLVDGEARAMAPATGTHARIQTEIAGLLRDHLRRVRSPCQILTNAGIIPKVGSENNFRIPDLLLTCAPDQRGQIIVPDPILVIEVLSPSNRAETWANVWAYTTIPSVREILVVHTDTICVQLLRRSADGNWPDTADRIENGDMALASVDASIPVTDLYAGTWLTAAG